MFNPVRGMLRMGCERCCRSSHRSRESPDRVARCLLDGMIGCVVGGQSGSDGPTYSSLSSAFLAAFSEIPNPVNSFLKTRCQF